MKLSFLGNALYLCATVLSSIAIWSLYHSASTGFVETYSWFDDAFYTRGKIHFETMENGLKFSCWNTAKQYLTLVCPNLRLNSAIEVEVAFYLTSCYCESIGRVPLFCDFDAKSSYGQTLANCGKGKCHNKYGHDSFHTILARMYDLCYYYLKASSPDIKPIMTNNDLVDMITEAKGGESGRPVLKHLVNIIFNELEDRKIKYKVSFQSYVDEFLMVLEDLGYHLGLVQYKYNH